MKNYFVAIALLSLTALPTFSANNSCKWKSESSASSVMDNVLGKSHLQKKLARKLEDSKVAERLATESLLQSISTDLSTQQNLDTIFALKRLQVIALIVNDFSAEDAQIASIEDVDFKNSILTKQIQIKHYLGIALKQAMLNIKNSQNPKTEINKLKNALVTLHNKIIIEHQKLSIKLQKSSNFLAQAPQDIQNNLNRVWLFTNGSLCDQLADPTLQNTLNKQSQTTLDIEQLPILIDQAYRQAQLINNIISLWKKQIV